MVQQQMHIRNKTMKGFSLKIYLETYNWKSELLQTAQSYDSQKSERS